MMEASGFKRSILITGGAGFIGSHVVRRFVKQYPHYLVVNFDALTYAGNLENLTDLEHAPNYRFVCGDIANLQEVRSAFEAWRISDVVHLAAESHVDRSIADPTAFVRTNVMGTLNLLLCARDSWNDSTAHRFFHVSTDEVFGSLGQEGYFIESSPYDPRSPYSASKAGADHLVRAFFHTYGLPIVISNCSNNYGPNQFPEKLIPLIINNLLEGRDLPVYGKGLNVRDWLWVMDHAAAIDLLFHRAAPGSSYNIGGNCEMSNIALVRLLCRLVDEKFGKTPGASEHKITFVADRPGHDHRYAIDTSKIFADFGWKPTVPLEEGLRQTIEWYVNHRDWLQNVCSGAYREYYRNHYDSKSG
ncbi:MAG: dTDP-glucose 4,6-dehydratase [Saprospiraceae bacterium]|jgi:dTDP-glucose 4,6-dehydratase|nr:dTDP-glucose 4,6-dehydratase [Saprospiraceae bacterium]